MLAILSPAFALDLVELLKPDDVMLRKPARKQESRASDCSQPVKRATPAPAAVNPALAPAAVKPVQAPVAVKPAQAPVVAKPVQAPVAVKSDLPSVVIKTNFVTHTDYVIKTNFVTQTDFVTATNFVIHTDYVIKTNFVTQTDFVTATNFVTHTDYVTKTNFVTQTDVVTATNFVTHTDYVIKTNFVTQTDVVTETNFVTHTDYVIKTNFVTQTDYVVQTNVVVEKRIDESEKIRLENRSAKAEKDAKIEREARESAEAARSAAERKAVVEQVARVEAESEIARMKAALDKANEAKKRTEDELKAAETKVAVAEKKAAAAETAREEVAAQVDEVARRALYERKARERAEAEKRAAERRAETERNAAVAVARKLDAVTNAPPPTVETPDYAPDRPETVVGKTAKPGTASKNAHDKEKKLTGRDAIITAERMDFDRKEGVILFDRNVYVDDEQYQMHADRLFVFLETNAVDNAGSSSRKKASGGMSDVAGSGTSLKRLVAIGHVSITNDARSAYCARATYAKKTGKIVMYGNDEITPWILDPQQSKTPQYGEKITFWTISEQIEVEKPVLSGAALGGGKGGNPLDALKR